MSKFISHKISFIVIILLLVSLGGLIFAWLVNYQLGPIFSDSIKQQSAINPKIFQKDNSIIIAAVGDVMLSRVVGQKMVKYNDYNYPFLETADWLKSADITFGNLETAITPGEPVLTGSYLFRADTATANALKENGFDIVSLANNHTPNYGQIGLNNTFFHLDSAGVKYVGAGENSEIAELAVFTEIKGIVIAWLAYNDSDVVPTSYGATDDRAGTNLMSVEKVAQVVSSAKQQADIVIVSMHSGTEYTTEPNQRQQDFARAAIDAGADLIIGHHPHWVQQVEVYKGKYIFYSLGNFIFDQMWSEETRQGLAIKIHFKDLAVEQVELQPLVIEDYSQPRFVFGDLAEKILNNLGVDYYFSGEKYYVD